MVRCSTQEEALVKISANLISEKNRKVHQQNTRGAKTIFWAEIAGKTGFGENSVFSTEK